MQQTIIRANLGRFLVEGRTYPHPLPPGLTPWYCYCSDGGHCALVCLEEDYQATADDPSADLFDYLLPAPIKTVLRGYRIAPARLRGQQIEIVVADIPYSRDVGLLAPPDDTEF